MNLRIQQEREPTAADLRRSLLLAIMQVRYDRKPQDRDRPIHTKECRKYLPNGSNLNKFEILNGVRFLRAHKLIERVGSYGWSTNLTEHDVPNICFEHGLFKPCEKCSRKEG